MNDFVQIEHTQRALHRGGDPMLLTCYGFAVVVLNDRKIVDSLIVSALDFPVHASATELLTHY